MIEVNNNTVSITLSNGRLIVLSIREFNELKSLM